MRFDQIEQILTADWLINRDTYLRYLPLLIAFMKGQEITASSLETDNLHKKPYVIRSGANLIDKWELTDLDIPENSIAVIPIQGVIMKYGYNGSAEMMVRINQAIFNPNISSILFLVETPGGMVVNTDLLSALVKDCPKPTMAFVTRMAASAGMWGISACDRIVASSKLDMFGSIGTMTTAMDEAGLFLKLGIDLKEVYATKSIKKNHDSRELFGEKKNDKPLIARLDFINEYFHATIKENLGIAENSEVFDGDIFYTEDAISLGLCHEILPINDAIEQIHEMGLNNKIKQFV